MHQILVHHVKAQQRQKRGSVGGRLRPKTLDRIIGRQSRRDGQHVEDNAFHLQTVATFFPPKDELRNICYASFFALTMAISRSLISADAFAGRKLSAKASCNA